MFSSSLCWNFFLGIFPFNSIWLTSSPFNYIDILKQQFSSHKTSHFIAALDELTIWWWGSSFPFTLKPKKNLNVKSNVEKLLFLAPTNTKKNKYCVIFKSVCHLIVWREMFKFLWPNILGIYNGCAIKILRQSPLSSHEDLKSNKIEEGRRLPCKRLSSHVYNGNRSRKRGGGEGG